MPVVTPKEPIEWQEIAELEWPSVLIGNGLSRRFSNRFAYDSLFREAMRSVEDAHALTGDDQSLFTALNTKDFETVLSHLARAQVVLKALGKEAGFLSERYASVKSALIDVVNRIHPNQGVLQGMLVRLRDALAFFENVYTTNYDLLIYWAMMQNPSGFNDYFRLANCRTAGEWVCFRRSDVSHLRLNTNVLYIHGALHLYEMVWGQTVKFTSSENEGRLLDRFRTRAALEETASPLFVSEGTAEQKMATIDRSDYLRYAFDDFVARGGPLVVFGHSLGDSDRHIVEGIAGWSPTTIAVGLRSPESLRQMEGRLEALLPVHQLLFFRAASHPLADLGFPFGRPVTGSWADRMDLPE